jgi:hypothetical protein
MGLPTEIQYIKPKLPSTRFSLEDHKHSPAPKKRRPPAKKAPKSKK